MLETPRTWRQSCDDDDDDDDDDEGNGIIATTITTNFLNKKSLLEMRKNWVECPRQLPHSPPSITL